MRNMIPFKDLQSWLDNSTQKTLKRIKCRENEEDLFLFRNGNPSTVKTKFFGVAGGRVQFEDCLFDGVESPEVEL